MIKLLYGDDYDIYPISVDCAHQGHGGVARSRVYIVLAHKERCRLVDPTNDIETVYKLVSRYIQRYIKTSPRDYLIAEHWEIMRDAMETARTRKKVFTPAPRLNIGKLGKGLISL